MVIVGIGHAADNQATATDRVADLLADEDVIDFPPPVPARCDVVVAELRLRRTTKQRGHVLGEGVRPAHVGVPMMDIGPGRAAIRAHIQVRRLGGDQVVIVDNCTRG